MNETSGNAILIGIDVGTQSIRAIAFDGRGRKLAAGQQPTPVVATGNGEAEYDPDAIFATVLSVLREVGRALGGRPVAGLAVASVGESCVLVGADGRALGRSITWFDWRSEPEARAVAEAIGPARIFAITGHSVDPILTLCKLAWMRQHRKAEVAASRRVLLMADWVAYRLSGEIATDPTLACRTLYFDLHRRRWSQEMLDFVQLDIEVLPPIMPSGTALGAVRREVLADTGIAGAPIVGVGGHDHLVGSYAAGLVRPGIVLDSLGTAEAMLLATAAPIEDPEIIRRGYFQGLIGRGDDSYLGGGINSSGGSIEWLRRLIGNPPHAELITEAASVPPGSGGVLFLPHFGNGPPPEPAEHPRGAFLGLTAQASPGVLYRAILEGLALQARHMLDGMIGIDAVTPPEDLRVIGGGSRNELFLKIKASVFGRSITVIEEAEASALGAALLGGIAAGLWPDLPAAYRALERRERVIEPGEDAARYEELRHIFLDASAALRSVNAKLGEFEAATGNA